ncbi:MAG: pimeloyl-ACP methyl ester esterase BioH [Woeseiaceae bacterium]
MLYSDIKGNGENIVLLHGWGMHSGLWGEFLNLLSDDFTTHAIDLAGFGYSKEVDSDYTLERHTENIEDYIKNLTSPVNVIAWSLGGLVLLNILLRKNIKINKVILIATTPCFTKKESWPHAIEGDTFNQFALDLKQDFKKTLKRFLSLQTRGSDLSRDDLRELNKKLDKRGLPAYKALEQGLNILSKADLRKDLVTDIPAMTLLGEKDTLVPIEVKNEFSKIFKNCTHHILEKTGHAPFITQPKFCATQVKNFLNE